MLIRDYLEHNAATWPERLAYVSTAGRFTWGQTAERTRRLAAALQGLGLVKGDVVATLALDRQEVATTDADRGRETPWNTYVREGLPATPICSPSAEALAAAERPAAGDWLYFVTIDLQGTTLFTKDYPQHLANIELAKRNGVLDSAR